ncbi:type-1 fimbrial protein subunit A [Burkholderia lata]|uniref:fimbrial protein n=1 Tax=Burkholderia lata (strain ATCC 17760 / DSM 23089 / LMG 22485 / NCIMB 9086 / R18194 / 383) TaxID=482957 RepID=UPI0014539A82|nr:fimbrial protein [Burkholderia lata]VWC82624.1 type-1 fimbrial protein subunit A [Burkholderia lata]
MYEMSGAGGMASEKIMKRNEKPASARGQAKSMRGFGRLAFWLLTLAMLMLGLGSRAAFAQSASCSGTAQTIPVSMPSSVTVPRDAVNGTLLTAWISTPATNNYYSCTVSGSGSTGMVFEPLSMTKAGMTVIGPTGVTYTVWNTNVPGVGIAIGVRSYVNGCQWQAWLDLGTTGAPFPSPWTGWVCNTNGSVTNGGQAQMALVKTGAITAGTMTGGVLFEGGSAQSTTGTYTVATTSRKSFSLSSTIINVAACTTPNVTVNMGSPMRSEFTGIGSTTKQAVAVNVAVNACPIGLNSIQYQFIPVNAVLDSTNGVLALSSGSTATGIGLQLKDSNGNALKYNAPYTLTSYSKSTGGSYTIPLTARYYQTAAKVTAGSANAVLTFTMTYQ